MTVRARVLGHVAPPSCPARDCDCDCVACMACVTWRTAFTCCFTAQQWQLQTTPAQTSVAAEYGEGDPFFYRVGSVMCRKQQMLRELVVSGGFLLGAHNKLVLEHDGADEHGARMGVVQVAGGQRPVKGGATLAGLRGVQHLRET